MSDVGMTVRLDTSALDRRFSDAALRAAQEAFAKRVAFDTRDYVPVDTGTLRDSEAVNSDYASGRLVWNTPYAKRVYNLGSVRRTLNPNASPHWCEVAKQAHAPAWLAYAATLLGGSAS